MKNVVVLFALSVMFVSPACTQNSTAAEVPEAVKTAFQEKFPAAKKIQWEKEADDEWEAEFKLAGEKYSANFSSTGEWTETEHEIKESDIPENIKSILDENFSDYDIEDAEMAESSSGTSYEFEIEADGEEFDVVIDTQGQLTQTKEIEEEDED